jgi:hypothetical protein
MTSPLAHRTQTSFSTLIVAAERQQIEITKNTGAINSKWARRERAVALTTWLCSHPFQLAVTITFKRSIQGRPPSFEAARKIARRVIIDLERSIFGNLDLPP